MAPTLGWRWGGTRKGRVWPGWALTFPAQHHNLQSKATRTGTVSATPFWFLSPSIFCNLFLTKITNNIFTSSTVQLCFPVSPQGTVREVRCIRLQGQHCSRLKELTHSQRHSGDWPLWVGVCLFAIINRHTVNERLDHTILDVPSNLVF